MIKLTALVFPVLLVAGNVWAGGPVPKAKPPVRQFQNTVISSPSAAGRHKSFGNASSRVKPVKLKKPVPANKN